MLAHDGHANAEAEAGAAAGAFGCEERVKEFRQDIRRNPNAIILHGGGDAISGVSETDLDAARGARFANRLFGIANQIQENLNQLIRVTDNEGETRHRLELNFDIVAAEGMILELQRAVNDHVEIQGLFLRGGRTRKFEEILDDGGGAASLAVGHFELPLGVVVHALALAEKFAGSKDGGERIVQFVSNTGEHLAHCSELFGLDELGFEALHLGDDAAGDHGTVNFALFVEERAEIAFQATPFALFVPDANLDGSKV